MKRALKIVAALAAVLLLLIVAVTVLARILITPERIKAVVIPRAEAALQREVSLDDVAISLFSGIRLNGLTVFERAGGEPFIAAETVVLRYKFWPLLFKQVIVDEIRLVAPAIRIERQADGAFNFGDLLAREAPAPEAAADEPSGQIDLLVSKIEVVDGSLLFIDHALAAGAPFRQEISELKLAARDISLTGEFPFDFAARVNAGTLSGEGVLDPQAMAGRVALAVADLDLAPFAPYYREQVPAQVNALRLQAKIEAQGNRQAVQSRGQLSLAPIDLLLAREGKDPLPVRNASLSVDYAASAELAAAAIEIEKANLALNGIPLQIVGRVADYATAPKLNLRLTLPEVALPQVLAKLPAELVAPVAELQPAGQVAGEFHLAGAVSAPKKLLQKGEVRLAGVSALVNGQRPALTGVLQLAGDSLAAENLQLAMGDNRATIDLQVANLLGETLRVRSQLRSERFALDPLLQGSAAPAAAPRPPAGAKDPFPLTLPVEAEGSVAIAETLYKGLIVRDFDLAYRLQQNVLTIQRLNGKVAAGTFAVSGNADLGRQAPTFVSRLALQGIQAEPLLQAFYPQLAGTVSGTLNLQTQLAGSGSEAAAVKKTLTGEGSLLLSDGRLTGTRLLQGLAEFLALPELRELRFNRSEGAFTVRQGQLSVNSDINGRNVRLHPQGTIALDGFAVDLALNLQLAPELVARLGKGKATALLADAQGWTKLPVKVGGTLTSPRFTLDTAAVGERLQEKAGEELRRKLRKELDRRFPPAGSGQPPEESGRPGAEELLRGLFGR